MPTAASLSKRKYNDKNYVHIHLQVKPELKEVWTSAAAATGESLTTYITEAVAQRMEREEQK